MDKVDLDLSRLLGYRIIAGGDATLSLPKIGVKSCTVQDGLAAPAREPLAAKPAE